MTQTILSSLPYAVLIFVVIVALARLANSAQKRADRAREAQAIIDED